jgi:hypothetical protein
MMLSLLCEFQDLNGIKYLDFHYKFHLRNHYSIYITPLIFHLYLINFDKFYQNHVKKGFFNFQKFIFNKLKIHPYL